MSDSQEPNGVFNRTETPMPELMSSEEEEEQLHGNEEEEGQGLFSELTEKQIQEAKERANEILLSRNAFDQKINLEKDQIVIPGQKFCVVQWVGPSFKSRTEIYGLRILGAFKSLSEANNHAKKVHIKDNRYDVGVLEMNLWCLNYPTDINQTQEEYDNDINKFIIKQKVSLEEAKQIFLERNQLIKKSTIKKEVDDNNRVFKGGKITEEMETAHKIETSMWYKKKTNEKESSVSVSKEEITRTEELDHDCNYKIPNQEYAVISYTGQTGKNKRIPICIKGVFTNEKEAMDHIEQLMSVDDTFDIIPSPMYRWIPCDPDTEKVRNIYKDKRLNELLETDEHQKVEASAMHRATQNHSDLNNPINNNNSGQGIIPATEEEEEEESTPTEILHGLENFVSTYSFNNSSFNNSSINNSSDVVEENENENNENENNESVD